MGVPKWKKYLALQPNDVNIFAGSTPSSWSRRPRRHQTQQRGKRTFLPYFWHFLILFLNQIPSFRSLFLRREEIDNPHKEKTWGVFTEDFAVGLRFAPPPKKIINLCAKILIYHIVSCEGWRLHLPRETFPKPQHQSRRCSIKNNSSDRK